MRISSAVRNALDWVVGRLRIACLCLLAWACKRLNAVRRSIEERRLTVELDLARRQKREADFDRDEARQQLLLVEAERDVLRAEVNAWSGLNEMTLAKIRAEIDKSNRESAAAQIGRSSRELHGRMR